MRKPHYCSNCGADFKNVLEGGKYAALLDQPDFYQCSRCQHITYKNPLPVVVALIPVTAQQREGLLLVRRSQSQKLALPGGFIDPRDETIGFAAAREVREETGISILSSDDWTVFDTIISPESGTVLTFVEWKYSVPAETVQVKPPENPETDAVDFAWDPQVPLAFPLHQKVLLGWFARRFAKFGSVS